MEIFTFIYKTLIERNDSWMTCCQPSMTSLCKNIATAHARMEGMGKDLCGSTWVGYKMWLGVWLHSTQTVCPSCNVQILLKAGYQIVPSSLESRGLECIMKLQLFQPFSKLYVSHCVTILRCGLGLYIFTFKQSIQFRLGLLRTRVCAWLPI